MPDSNLSPQLCQREAATRSSARAQHLVAFGLGIFGNYLRDSAHAFAQLRHASAHFFICGFVPFSHATAQSLQVFSHKSQASQARAFLVSTANPHMRQAWWQISHSLAVSSILFSRQNFMQARHSFAQVKVGVRQDSFGIFSAGAFMPDENAAKRPRAERSTT